MLADQNLTIVVRKKTCFFLLNLTSNWKCNNETGYANEAAASFKTNDETKDSFLFTLAAISCQISRLPQERENLGEMKPTGGWGGVVLTEHAVEGN